MAAINSNPPEEKHRFLPNRCVTALFERNVEAAPAITALRSAGFLDSQIEVLVGPTGAERLDVDAKHESTGTQLLQALTNALADDAGYLERAAGELREGGTMISVFVDTDEKAAIRATEALKSHHGTEVQHWGDWITEQL